MSYLERLKDKFPENCPTEALTKPTEAPFVSSVSTRVGQKKPQPPLSRASRARRRKVLAMLARDGVQYAVLVEDADTDPVVMAVATPEGTREVLIPRDRYDPFEVLAKVGRWDTGLGRP